MIWKRVPKEKSVKPTTGKGYRDWKPFIAAEGFYQCVYCAIHENKFGGTRNYHVEHYKPKSLKEFKALTDEITNLFYACSICNCFKSDDWPDTPKDDFSNPSYPDPGKVEYTDLFEVSRQSGVIKGKNNAATYLIAKLFLNRPQLLLERQHHYLLQQLDTLHEAIADKEKRLEEVALTGNTEAIKLLAKLSTLSRNIVKALVDFQELRPYEDNDIKR